MNAEPDSTDQNHYGDADSAWGALDLGEQTLAEPVAEAPAQTPQPRPMAAPQARPASPPKPRPVAAPQARPVAAPSYAPIRPASVQPAPVTQPAPQPVAQPVQQPAPQPVQQPAPQPVQQPAPVTQPAPAVQPVAQPSPPIPSRDAASLTSEWDTTLDSAWDDIDLGELGQDQLIEEDIDADLTSDLDEGPVEEDHAPHATRGGGMPEAPRASQVHTPATEWSPAVDPAVDPAAAPTRRSRLRRPEKPKSSGSKKQTSPQAAKRATKQAEYGGRSTGSKIFRWTLYPVLALVFLSGTKQILTADEAIDTEALASQTAEMLGRTQFPVGAAETFASRFTSEYLTYGQRGYEKRAARLATYAPRIVDEGWGWDGVGKQRVINGPFIGATTKPVDDHNATITVTAQVSSGAWLALAVPVYASDSGALVVSGAPAFVALPPLAVNPEPDTEAPSIDEEASAWLAEQVLPGYFEAWGKSDMTELDRYTTAEASVMARTGLGGALTFAELSRVEVAEGELTENADGDEVPVLGVPRDAVVEVSWAVDGAGWMRQAYNLVVIQAEDGRWFVQDIDGGVLSDGGDAPDDGDGSVVVLPEDGE